ncbi:universal stress protein [Cellulomonas sp.]|uniref:universal stress protein n=1 Tax=Cellulomonas sp. TaxID=40001 RepID=UPI0025828898|nr:universal stress protein [Cellulomonas sp.]MCR6690041.1 universal stress protein [Cellulomonas sp.]
MRIDGPVVVAVDGTDRSAATLRWAAGAAVRRETRLVVAHVVSPPVGPWMWAGVPAVPVDEESLLRELRAACTAVAEAHPGLRVEGVLLHGPTVPTLTRFSADAQLLVAGTRHDGAAVLTIGTALSWRARCPVALVRGGVRAPEGPVVVGVDGTPGSWLAAGLAAREARRLGRALHVLHACRPGEDDEGRSIALDVAADLAQTYPDLEVRTLLADGDPVPCLVAASRTAGLLVVGAHRWRRTRGRLVGRRVAPRAACPVLVVRDEVL